MGEVDVDAKVLADLNRVEPSAAPFKAGEPRADGIQGHAQGQAHTGCAEGVVDVETGGHVKRDLCLTERGLHPEPRTRAGDAEVERMQVRGRRQTVRPA